MTRPGGEQQWLNEQPLFHNTSNTVTSKGLHIAKGRRQKAEGRRQKAEGRREGRKLEGRREGRKLEGRREL
ncbi:MAG: hypothetical protein F6K41_05110 [Symploca sp. SIO3E6]|nr:hypothetical protein [Caldora sp. SIO3E6]